MLDSAKNGRVEGDLGGVRPQGGHLVVVEAAPSIAAVTRSSSNANGRSSGSMAAKLVGVAGRAQRLDARPAAMLRGKAVQ